MSRLGQRLEAGPPRLRLCKILKKFLKLSQFGSIWNYMSALGTTLSQSSLANRIFDERQLGVALGGGAPRRYALVNRALKDGSLIRLKRGIYILGPSVRKDDVHPFAVAQALLPGSYVSFETALSFHGWIPEAVYLTASVTPGRKSLEQDTPVFGRFTFHPLAINRYQFLVGVERQTFGSMTAFIASPLRALLDLVALRKQGWADVDWLTSSLRIDEQSLLSIKRKEFAAMRPVYQHKAVNDFLQQLGLAVHSPSKAEG